VTRLLTDEPSTLSTRLVAYYRETVTIHADNPVTGVCGVCQVSRCTDWRFATERLQCAGESVDGHARPTSDRDS
jgi:hypothetical protein